MFLNMSFLLQIKFTISVTLICKNDLIRVMCELNVLIIYKAFHPYPYFILPIRLNTYKIALSSTAVFGRAGKDVSGVL